MFYRSGVVISPRGIRLLKTFCICICIMYACIYDHYSNASSQTITSVNNNNSNNNNNNKNVLLSARLRQRLPITARTLRIKLKKIIKPLVNDIKVPKAGTHCCKE